MTTIEPQPMDQPAGLPGAHPQPGYAQTTIAPWDPVPSGESGSASPPSGDPLIPADLGGWFAAVIGAVRRSWARLAALQLIVVALSVAFAGSASRVLGPLTAAGPGSASGAAPAALPVAAPTLLLAYLPIAALSFAVVVVVEAAAVFVVLREAAGRPAGVAAAVRFGMTRMFPLLGWQVVGGLVMVPAILLLLLPGIYVAVVVGGGLLGAVVVERRGLGRAFKLVNRRLWPTAGRLALAATILGVYYIAVRLAAGALGDGPLSMSTMIVQGLLQVPAAVVGSAVVVVTYAELRWRERPSAVTTGALAEEMDGHDSPRPRVAAAVLLALLVLAALIVPGQVAPAMSEAAPAARVAGQPGWAHPKVVGTAIAAGKNPHGIAVGPDGQFAFVIHNGKAGQPGDVTVINLVSRTPAVVFPMATYAWALAVTPDGRHAYVSDTGTDWDGNTVSVLDAGTNAVSARITVGLGPAGLAVTPDGRSVYVADSGSSTNPGGDVSVIDTATKRVTATVRVGLNPLGVAISRDGRFAYVPNYGVVGTPGNSITVIDTATNTVAATIAVAAWPRDVAVSPDGSKLYVTHDGPDTEPGSTVTVVDTATRVETATVPVGVSPTSVQFTPDGRNAYVVNSGVSGAGGDSVTVIDTATATPTDTVVVGNAPDGVAFSPNGQWAYVVNYDTGTISTIDTGAGFR